MISDVLAAPTAPTMTEFIHQDTAYVVDCFGNSRRGLMVFKADDGQAVCAIVQTTDAPVVVAGPRCRQEQADRLAPKALQAWADRQA